MLLTRRVPCWAWALPGLSLWHITGAGAQPPAGCTPHLAQGPFGTADPWTPAFDDKDASQRGQRALAALTFSTTAVGVRSLTTRYQGTSDELHHGASGPEYNYVYVLSTSSPIIQATVYIHPSTGRLVGLNLTTNSGGGTGLGGIRTGVPRPATPCPSAGLGRPLRLAYLRGRAGANGVQSLTLVWVPYTLPPPPPSPPPPPPPRPPPPSPPEPLEFAPPDSAPSGIIQKG